MKKNWTGERLETFIYTRDAIEHLHRYAIVDKYIEGKIVLDIASGEGYGSNLMSEKATFVYGVDIDTTAVQAAKLKYKKENLDFLTGSAIEIPVKDSSIDVVVSFETIEHHDKHCEMMAEIKRVLKPNGILIISTPDKFYYSDKRKFNNPFHIKELYKNEFKSLISNYFSNKQLLYQKYTSSNSIIIDENKFEDVVFFTGNYSKISTTEIEALYLILIASDIVFVKQNVSFFDGSQSVINSQIEESVKKIHNSNTYKIGSIVLLPFKMLKRFLNYAS
jgi:ubiquinone/menaquinone biosynthesis C-methylase UbiE